ncbi:amidohydrolase family protein [Lederbergia sp. NSJ-179]|uniref:amidohydrolase family protein n=1 Tax=Lederbergia sp. NSJ-179 TaxID=2931402 RepID=UPI001FD53DF5|nr:amidohydrolase family protein [Lederbergia sp. NSJ-179]MCJ7840736.1 amidohydrolase family protein [Lederbergia sp. NSJ-179]
MRIDAHQHYWQLDNDFTNWPTADLKTIYRDFLPADLEPNLKKHKMDQTIVVQAAPNVKETDFLLELADKNNTIAGVVGWLDLSAANFPEQFTQYREHPKFVGLRPMLQDLSDDRWILRPEVKRNIEILVEDDFPIDLLIYPKHLPHMLELLEEFPTLRAVIDHCAKPNIKEEEWDVWAEGIEKIAQHRSVMCKVSGLVTEANHESWKVNDFKPYLEQVFQEFGPERVMFGSDWPVCLLAGTYEDVIKIAHDYLSKNVKARELALFMGENAKTFYKIDRKR